MNPRFEAVRRHLDFMRKPIPEPEYQQAYETYYVGLEQYADATDRIVQRQPRVMNVTLELYKAPLPPEASRGPLRSRRRRSPPRRSPRLKRP